MVDKEDFKIELQIVFFWIKVLRKIERSEINELEIYNLYNMIDKTDDEFFICTKNIRNIHCTKK